MFNVVYFDLRSDAVHSKNGPSLLFCVFASFFKMWSSLIVQMFHLTLDQFIRQPDSHSNKTVGSLEGYSPIRLSYKTRKEWRKPFTKS